MWHEGKIWAKVDVQNRTHQGCLLLATLFLLFVGEVLHAPLRGGDGGVLWTMSSFLKHFDYARCFALTGYATISIPTSK